MKASWYIILLALFVGAVLVPCQNAPAQTVVHGDTMYVDWQDSGTHLPIINALRNAVYGDTASDGTRANLNRVYLLQLNGIYWESDRIENKDKSGTPFPLRLVGQPYTMGDASNFPAQLQLTDLRSDNTAADTRLITGLTDVTLQNLYITGRTNSQGVQTSYQPIQIDASNSRFLVDNCIIEQSNFAVIAFTATNNEIVYTNNKFRNLIGSPSTQQWEGRAISIWADQDSVIVENNTFFNIEFTPFQLEGGAAKYIRFNHNTIVNNGRGINTGNWFRNAYFANNLIIDGWWHGEGASDLQTSGRDPRQTNAGLFTIGALPSVYGPEEGRRIVVAKCYAYLDPKFLTAYGDTIHRAYFIDPVTKLDFLDLYTAHMNVGHAGTTDTVWLGSVPTGMSYPLNDPAWKTGVANSSMFDSMWSNITMLRAGISNATPYFYKQDGNPSNEAWPLPENFSYTQSNLMTAGTDGLPIGDLNWFPTQKATFNANKASYVSAIEGLAGQVINFKVDSTYEAEYGTVAGTAAVNVFSGFSYFYMQNGGFIQWDFNLAAGGNYGMNIWSHLRGNSQRGEHFFINGNEIHDNYGWGELEFTSSQLAAGTPGTHGPGMTLDDNSWNWYYYPKDSILAADTANFHFVTGHNTIKITPSWGYQNFAGIDLIAPGTVVPVGQTVQNPVIALRAPDATSSIVTPMGEGAKWIPSLFKSVILGATGTVSFNIPIGVTGNYHVRIFYYNPGTTPLTVQIKEGSTLLDSPVLTAKSDSTGSDVMSGVIALSAGNHTLTLGGANANIDYVQIIREVVGAVEPGQVPGTFSLSQNYPNPFNPTTRIQFTIGKAANTKLIVYNVLGQKVMTLVDSRMDAGSHIVEFNAMNLASGVYFYRLEAGNYVMSKKMVLLK